MRRDDEPTQTIQMRHNYVLSNGNEKGRSDLANMSDNNSSVFDVTSSIKSNRKIKKIPLTSEIRGNSHLEYRISSQLFLLPIKSMSDVTLTILEFH